MSALKHKTTDPACVNYRPPRGPATQYIHDYNRGISCPICMPPIAVSACGEILTAGYSTVLDCVREQGHEGSHRSYGGSEWGPESGGSGS